MKTITLNDITACPWNPRSEITGGSVAELAKSIEETGLLSPIVIWKRMDADGWYCIAGCRRLAAMKSIKGRDFDDGDYAEFQGSEAEARAITVIENLQREGVNPIAEAKAVVALLDAGANEQKVAVRFGKTQAWVRRRRKLAAIDEAWANRSGEMTVDALERIATYPAAVQKRVAADTNKMRILGWGDVSHYFDIESRDIDTAKFDCEECCKCMMRTGAEGDLFAVNDGKLGKCMSWECFDAKQKAHEESLIEAAVGGKNVETVKYDYEWQLPAGDFTSKKRDKKHPCAHVCILPDGTVKVVWTASEADRRREREKREEARRQDNAEREARRRRIVAIRDRLSQFCEAGEDGEYPQSIRDKVVKLMSRPGMSEAKQMFADAAVENICEWHSDEGWCGMLATFDWLAELAGVSKEDVEYFTAETNGDDENNKTENEEE